MKIAVFNFDKRSAFDRYFPTLSLFVHVMAEGQTAGAGSVATVLTDARLSQVYGCPLRTGVVPANVGVFVLPQTARA